MLTDVQTPFLETPLVHLKLVANCDVISATLPQAVRGESPRLHARASRVSHELAHLRATPKPRLVIPLESPESLPRLGSGGGVFAPRVELRDAIYGPTAAHSVRVAMRDL